MVVHARRAAHRLGQVLGAHGVDAVVPYALAHQRAQVRPDRVPLAAGEVLAGPVGVDTVPEQHLRAVHVAHARDDLLVHEQGGHGDPAAGDPLPGPLAVVAGAQRVGAQPVVYRALLGAGDQRACGGAAQIRVVRVAEDAQPDRVGGRRGRGRTEAELAEQAEVDVDPAGVLEAEEEVLAVGVRGVQHPAVEQGGAVGELPLRAAHAHRPPGEPVPVVVREAVDGVSLGHGCGSPR